MDASVQTDLDRVTFVAPFPEGATDKERTYTINFNPQSQTNARMKKLFSKICLPILLAAVAANFARGQNEQNH